MTMPGAGLAGMHHVSALSARIAESHRFYAGVLGMRPLIRTVNQDDPSMYHLFYGDGAGTPGSDMTVFDLAHTAPEFRGSNRISRTTFRVAGADALSFWAGRLAEYGVAHAGVQERDGHAALDFDDPVGTELSLVDDGGAGQAFPWNGSAVAPALQIRGLGYSELTVPKLEPTDRFLTGALGFVRDHEFPVADAPRFATHVYRLAPDGLHATLHVVVRDDLPRTRYGSGGVHHLALRVPAGQDMAAWVRHLETLGYPNSGIVDRHYFQSIYVRERNGILFELATEGPGFEVDGPIDGERLTLPPSLEPRRAEITARLQPIEG